MEHSIEQIQIEETLTLEGRELNPSRLPKVLRYIGAITLTLSAISFAVNRVGELDSLGKFYSFLIFTVVLAICGFGCALKLKEDKGARTFLGISLVFIPALFLQLSGLIYFLVHGVPNIPQFFVLTAPNLMSVVIALAISLPIAGIITFGGFSALVRSKAKILSAVFLTIVIALLIPTRIVDEVSMIILALGLLLATVSHRLVKNDACFQTFEGRIALSILALPLMLMVCRTFCLYGVTALFGTAMFVVLGIFLWNFSSKKESDYAPITQLFALGSFAAAWAWFVDALISNPTGIFYISELASAREMVCIPLVFLPIATGLYFLSRNLGKSERSVVRTAGYIAAIPMTVHVFQSGSSLITAVSLFVGCGIITEAFLRKDRHLLGAGSILLSSVFILNLHYALDIYHYNPWRSLGITGVGIVLASSFLETNMSALISRAKRVRMEFAEWE
jgi:hypothetical protein